MHRIILSVQFFTLAIAASAFPFDNIPLLFLFLLFCMPLTDALLNEYMSLFLTSFYPHFQNTSKARFQKNNWILINEIDFCNPTPLQ